MKKCKKCIWRIEVNTKVSLCPFAECRKDMWKPKRVRSTSNGKGLR